MARGLHGVLWLPARDERVPLVHALRPALLAALGGHGQLPLPVPAGPAGLARGAEHALADARLRAAAGAVRARRGDDAVARAARDRLLPDGLLPPRSGADGRGHARVRLPHEPGDGAGEHDPGPPRDPGAALV